jgi:hypothetical protein
VQSRVQNNHNSLSVVRVPGNVLSVFHYSTTINFRHLRLEQRTPKEQELDFANNSKSAPRSDQIESYGSISSIAEDKPVCC